MEYTQNIAGNELKVNISGRFTFSDHKSFREILQTIDTHHVSRLVIDFSGTEFVDSAALGMILLAREEINKKGGSVLLINANGQVEKVFRISHFFSLFQMQ